MDWSRILACVTGTVDQELLALNEYLAAENRILTAKLNGRPKLSDTERATLGEIGHRLGRKVLAEVARWRGQTPSWAGTASLSPASSMARKPVAAQADRGSGARSSSASFAWPRRTAPGAMTGSLGR